MPADRFSNFIVGAPPVDGQTYRVIVKVDGDFKEQEVTMNEEEDREGITAYHPDPVNTAADSDDSEDGDDAPPAPDPDDDDSREDPDAVADAPSPAFEVHVEGQDAPTLSVVNLYHADVKRYIQRQKVQRVMSDEVFDAKAKALIDSLRERNRVDRERKRSMSHYKEQLDELQTTIDELLGPLEQGFEQIEVECEVVLDFARGKKRVIDCVTREIYEETDLTPDDHQLRMDLDKKNEQDADDRIARSVAHDADTASDEELEAASTIYGQAVEGATADTRGDSAEADVQWHYINETSDIPQDRPITVIVFKDGVRRNHYGMRRGNRFFFSEPMQGQPAYMATLNHVECWTEGRVVYVENAKAEAEATAPTEQPTAAVHAIDDL